MCRSANLNVCCFANNILQLCLVVHARGVCSSSWGCHGFDELMDFLEAQYVLLCTWWCESCEEQCSIDRGHMTFVCFCRHSECDSHHRLVRSRCQYWQSMLTGSFLNEFTWILALSFLLFLVNDSISTPALSRTQTFHVFSHVYWVECGS